MATGWAWHLIEDDTLVADLGDAQSKSVTWRLGSAGEASFSCDGEDPIARKVQELRTDLLVSFNGERLWRGRIGGSIDSTNPDDDDVAFTAVDYRGLLARKLLGADRASTMSPAAGAWDLVDYFQGRTNGDMGITDGLRAPGSAMSLTAKWGQSVEEVIDQYSKLFPGSFDWWIDGDLVFNSEDFRGGTRSFGLIYGETVASYTRTVTSADYANVVRASGADGVTPYIALAPDYATRPEGRWEAQIGDPDLTTNAQVQALAEHELARRSALAPAYTLQLVPGVWTPDLLWVGDLCPIRIDHHRLDVDTQDRVQDITVTDGGDGGTDVAITTGTDFRRDFAALIHATGERLTALARR